MVNIRREALSWFVTVLLAVVSGLVIVQVTTALAFASVDPGLLNLPSIWQNVADYASDDDAPQLASLQQNLIAEASDEDRALNDAKAAGQVLVAPARPGGGSASNSLSSTRTSQPTAAVTQTPPASPTPGASPTSAPASVIALTLTDTNTSTAAPTTALRSPTPTVNASATTAPTNTTLPPVGSTALATVDPGSTATATAPPSATASATNTPAPPPIPDTGLTINYQPGDAPLPPGALADTGEMFGQRGNGFTYGWNAPNFHAVDRNLVPDQRYDTLNFMQQDGWFSWEIEVPNGMYTVHIVAGDPCCTDSKYRIRVESIMAIQGEPSEREHWLEAVVVIQVSDGRLTVSNGFGAQNNRVNFIEIFPGAVSITPTPPTQNASPTATPTSSLKPSKTPTATRTPTIPSPTPTHNTNTIELTQTPSATLTETPSATPTHKQDEPPTAESTGVMQASATAGILDQTESAQESEP